MKKKKRYLEIGRDLFITIYPIQKLITMLNQHSFKSVTSIIMCCIIFMLIAGFGFTELIKDIRNIWRET